MVDSKVSAENDYYYSDNLGEKKRNSSKLVKGFRKVFALLGPGDPWDD